MMMIWSCSHGTQHGRGLNERVGRLALRARVAAVGVRLAAGAVGATRRANNHRAFTCVAQARVTVCAALCTLYAVCAAVCAAMTCVIQYKHKGSCLI